MTLQGALRARVVRWVEEFDGYGWAVEDVPPTLLGFGELDLRARRPQTYGGPPSVIDIRELWRLGADPDGLSLVEEDCYLARSKWHAQITPAGDLGADRLDFQRDAKTYPIVHRHPFGETNDVRLDAFPLAAPEAWLAEVESIIINL